MIDTDRVKTAFTAGKDMAKAETDEQGEEAIESFAGDSGGLLADNRGQVNNMATKAVSLVVALMVGGIVAAFLLPVAIDELVAVDTSAWGSGASSLWDIMDVIVVLAVFLFFIGVALSATNKL